MKVKIDKGIPFPSNYERNRKYPWKEMAVGDSFLTDCTQQNVSSGMASIAGKTYAPKQFRSRMDADGLYRIWRIK